MPRARYLVILGILIAMPSVNAGEVFNYPSSELSQALAVVREFLEGKPPRYSAFRNGLKNLDPKGPVFANQVLAILAEDSSPWKSYSEPRASVLSLVTYAVLDFEPSPTFEGSDLKRSIHLNAQKVLSKFPIASERQREVIEIFNHLDLWDETDLPFLMRKFFNRHHFNPKIAPFLRFFEGGSPEFKAEFVERVHKSPKKDILEYAFLYRFGLMRDEEIVWMFRLSMADHLAGVSRSNGLHVRSLLDWVIFDLHRRLRQGDPPVVAAYDKVRASPNWSGNQNWSAKDHEAINQFLRGLWTGIGVVSCESLIEHIPSNDVEH